jgi:hypothetical protein
LFKARSRKPKLIQKIDKYARIFRCGANENVQIACVTRPPVKCETLRANDDIINAAGV